MTIWELPAAMLLLAAINTGGGAQIEGDVDARDVAGRDYNVSRDHIINMDTPQWRLTVDERLRTQREMILSLQEANELLQREVARQWMTIASVVVIFLFTLTILVGIATRRLDRSDTETTRQFDLISSRIERQFDLMNQRLDGIARRSQ